MVNEFMVQALMVASGASYKTQIPSKILGYYFPFVFGPNSFNVLLIMLQNIANVLTPL